MSDKRKSESQSSQIVKKSCQYPTAEDELEDLRQKLGEDRLNTIMKTANNIRSWPIMKIANKIRSLQQPSSACRIQANHSNKLVEKMERLLTLWVEDLIQKNVSLNLHIIYEKAKCIFEELKKKEGGDETFESNTIWFRGYKSRTKSLSDKLPDETLIKDIKETEEAFLAEFKTIVENGKYPKDLIFNVNETRLYWKGVLSYGLSYGFNDKLTLLLGGNASGTLKLKPLLVYHSKTPIALKGLNKLKLPVFWESNKKSWVTPELFLDWYTNHFCTVVYNFCIENDLPPKAILLLDSSPSHPLNIAEVHTKLKVNVVYIPSTVSVLQPMDLSIISTFKAYYLQEYFKDMVTILDINQMDKKGYSDSFNLLKAIYFIDIAWKKVSKNCFNAAWKELLPKSGDDFEESAVTEESTAVIQNVSELAREAAFAWVIDEEVLEFINRKGEEKGLSTKELVDLAEHLNAQREEDKNSDEPESKLKIIETDDLKKLINSGISMIDFCCNMDHDWERSNFLRNSLNEAMAPYYEILKERKQKIQKPSFTIRPIQQFVDKVYSLIDECCVFDHDEERTSSVEENLIDAITPYEKIIEEAKYEVLEEKKNGRQKTLDSYFKKVPKPHQSGSSVLDDPQPGPSSCD